MSVDSQSIKLWEHGHDFSTDYSKGEFRTKIVIGITFTMMVVEVAAGYIFGSMALLADGWHMGTHVAALSITVFVYMYARLYRNDPRYSLGTGKMDALGGFASAVALAVVALMIGIESLERVFSPTPISLNEAIFVAVVGLLVNLTCAVLLGGHTHGHEHGFTGHSHGSHSPRSEGHNHTEQTHLHDDHEHNHHHHDSATHEHSHKKIHAEVVQDHNLKSAYFHVLADAFTSLLAIGALLAAKYFGWLWVDTAMGFVGAGVIAWWATGLVRDSSKVLLDESAQGDLTNTIRAAIEGDADNRVTDLHVWRVGSNHWAAMIAILTHYPRTAAHYKGLINHLQLAHVSLEVNRAPGVVEIEE